jgi:hypothetical protein
VVALVACAHAYRDRGLSVFPVGQHKRPLAEWTPCQRALPDHDQIDAWWTRFPDANIGAATGAVSGIVALDADGAEGLESLTALNTPAQTWLAQTGRPNGGWHQFFQHPGAGIAIRNRTRLRPGLDVRGDGGYVVLPPSRHASGQKYRWLTAPDEMALAWIPDDLLPILCQPGPTSGNESPSGDFVSEGERNDHLYRLARSLKAKGCSDRTIRAALSTENRARCRPQLSAEEVGGIADNAFRQPNRHDFNGTRVEAPERKALKRSVIVPDGPCLIDLTTITPRPIDWIWPGRLGRGKLTELIGEPDLGKSLISIDLAARVSTGRAWPDGTKGCRGRTILMTAEDGLDDTVVPRLIAAGADLAMVSVLRMASRGGVEHLVTLDKHRDILERALRDFDATLLIIDPLSAYLGDVDSHRDAALRGVLTPFADLLDRTRVACVGLLHPPKQAVNLIYFASGSGAFTAQARVVLGVGKDPADESGARRLLVKIKGNLFGDVPTLAYRVVVPDGETATLEWEPQPVDGVSARDVLGLVEEREEHSARQRARDFLHTFLADGPRYASDVFEHANADGIARKTLHRAKDDLGVTSYKTGQPGKTGQAWAWGLPNQEPQ